MYFIRVLPCIRTIVLLYNNNTREWRLVESIGYLFHAVTISRLLRVGCLEWAGNIVFGSVYFLSVQLPRVLVSVAHRCWPFTWRPITMAIPWWCHRTAVVAQVLCPALKTVVCPPLSPMPPPPPREYWCTTTRNRPTRIAWVSLRIRRRLQCPRRLCLRRLCRRSSGPRKNVTSHDDRTTRTTTSGCLITVRLPGDLRVSASRVICTSSMTTQMTANCFRFVYYMVLQVCLFFVMVRYFNS